MQAVSAPCVAFIRRLLTLDERRFVVEVCCGDDVRSRSASGRHIAQIWHFCVLFMAATVDGQQLLKL